MLGADPLAGSVFIFMAVSEFILAAADAADVPVGTFSLIWSRQNASGTWLAAVVAVANRPFSGRRVSGPVLFKSCPLTLLGDRSKGLADRPGRRAELRLVVRVVRSLESLTPFAVFPIFLHRHKHFRIISAARQKGFDIDGILAVNEFQTLVEQVMRKFVAFGSQLNLKVNTTLRVSI